MSASAEARDVLAPTGSLRVALEDPSGLGEELARELGRQLRVPVVFAPDADVFLTRATRERALVFSPPYFENYAIGIAKERSRALPFLTEFVNDAVRRGVVRDDNRGRM